MNDRMEIIWSLWSCYQVLYFNLNEFLDLCKKNKIEPMLEDLV